MNNKKLIVTFYAVWVPLAFLIGVPAAMVTGNLWIIVVASLPVIGLGLYMIFCIVTDLLSAVWGEHNDNV